MRRSNKALYEQIMRNVSREVKRSLNEATYTFESDKSGKSEMSQLTKVKQIWEMYKAEMDKCEIPEGLKEILFNGMIYIEDRNDDKYPEYEEIYGKTPESLKQIVSWLSWRIQQDHYMYLGFKLIFNDDVISDIKDELGEQAAAISQLIMHALITKFKSKYVRVVWSEKHKDLYFIPNKVETEVGETSVVKYKDFDKVMIELIGFFSTYASFLNECWKRLKHFYN